MSRVSVAIPTWNAGAEFAEVLTAVRAQAGVGEIDLVIVDSDSADGTTELAERFGARVHRIDRRTFDHGATRNLAAAMTTGDTIAFLSQDALPADEHWLRALVDAVESERADGAYSRVLPRPGCSPLVQRTVEADLVFSIVRQVKQSSPEVLERMQPFERRIFFHFNNVASAVRRESFARRPFPRMRFGEDLAWGGQVLQHGGKLIFEPLSLVYHSHEPKLRQEFARHAQDARLMRVLFGFRNRDSWAACIPAWWQAWRDDRRWLRSRVFGLRRWRAELYAPVLRAAQIVGQRFGSLGEPVDPPVFPDRLPVAPEISLANRSPGSPV